MVVKNLKYLLLIATAALQPLQPPPIQAGRHPCDPHQGAPCDQASCNFMAKGGSYCSPTCHKDCCKCPDSCNGHKPDPNDGIPDPNAPAPPSAPPELDVILNVLVNTPVTPACYPGIHAQAPDSRGSAFCRLSSTAARTFAQGHLRRPVPPV